MASRALWIGFNALNLQRKRRHTSQFFHATVNTVVMVVGWGGIIATRGKGGGTLVHQLKANSSADGSDVAFQLQRRAIAIIHDADPAEDGLSLMTVKLDYINTLRGIAILMVLTVHAGQYVEVVEPATRWGARGVQLFFVASAFTLTASWERRNDGALAFYIRRIFRIGPPFWLGLILYASLAPASSVKFLDIVATATFTHGLFPQAINLVVPGGWSIADEMMFYAIFPLLIIAVRDWKLPLIALLLAALGSTFWAKHSIPFLKQLFPEADLVTISTFSFLALPAQMTAFAAGIAAYSVATKWPLRTFKWRVTIANIGLALALLWAVFLSVKSVHHLVGFGLLFGLVVLSMQYGAGRWIPNRILNKFGEISFSIYLVHFYLLTVINEAAPSYLKGWQRFIFLWVATAFACFSICSLIYRLVEVPSMNLGRRITRSITARA